MAPIADPLPVEQQQQPLSATDTADNYPPPTHPGLIHVNRSPKAFGSGAVSLVSLPAGAVLTKIEGITPGTKAYSSVQTGPDTHIELNSDLLYCNHSCAPSVVFDMKKMEVRVVQDRPLRAGDALTFFYPSTEWEMDQPFNCTCGAGEGVCKRWISGAKTMAPEELQDYWLNEHIVQLLEAKAGKGQ